MEILGIVALVLAILLLLAVVGKRLDEIEKQFSLLYRIESKLDFLLKQANLEFDPYANLARDVIEAVHKGENTRAIKLYRRTTGQRLKAAREFIAEVQRRLVKADEAHQSPLPITSPPDLA
jgi:hypothetical protein